MFVPSIHGILFYAMLVLVPTCITLNINIIIVHCILWKKVIIIISKQTSLQKSGFDSNVQCSILSRRVFYKFKTAETYNISLLILWVFCVWRCWYNLLNFLGKREGWKYSSVTAFTVVPSPLDWICHKDPSTCDFTLFHFNSIHQCLF